MLTCGCRSNDLVSYAVPACICRNAEQPALSRPPLSYRDTGIASQPSVLSVAPGGGERSLQLHGLARLSSISGRGELAFIQQLGSIETLTKRSLLELGGDLLLVRANWPSVNFGPVNPKHLPAFLSSCKFHGQNGRPASRRIGRMDAEQHRLESTVAVSDRRNKTKGRQGCSGALSLCWNHIIRRLGTYEVYLPGQGLV